MNDEIKELLSNDNIHIIECEKNWCNAYGYEKSQLKEDLLNYITNLQYKYENQIHRYKNLKNYATNLQEENEDLKDRLKVMEHFKNSLQEENEKLKELCAKYEEEHNTAFKLWTMKMEEVPTYEEKMIYKSRCEKAIEYIDSKVLANGEVIDQLRKIEIEELLNILNGGDE